MLEEEIGGQHREAVAGAADRLVPCVLHQAIALVHQDDRRQLGGAGRVGQECRHTVRASDALGGDGLGRYTDLIGCARHVLLRYRVRLCCLVLPRSSSICLVPKEQRGESLPITRNRGLRRSRPDQQSGAGRSVQPEPAPVWLSNPKKINRREGPMPSVRARGAGAALWELAAIGKAFMPASCL